MRNKNIAISEKAYQRLKSLKKPGESFTMVIERVARYGGILDLAGMLTPQEGKSMKEAIQRMRQDKAESRGHPASKGEKLNLP